MDCKILYNEYIEKANTKRQNKMLVKCKKTGRLYNPEKEFTKLFTKQWFIDIMTRLKFR
jgi:uncharacterized OB-fold protein